MGETTAKTNKCIIDKDTIKNIHENFLQENESLQKLLQKHQLFNEVPIKDSLFTTSAVENYINTISSETNKPFPYLHIENFCNHKTATYIQEEILQKIPVFHRETDLFRVAQTIDLNNISLDSSQAQRIPYLMTLQQYIYSETFRKFLQEIFHCEDLLPRVDCAAST